MQQQLEEITIALAGMLQSIALIREISHTGKCPANFFQASIYSIFQINPQNTVATFGNLNNIELGLQKIIQTFDTAREVDRAQHRYLLSLIHLQKRLVRSPESLTQLSQRLQRTLKQVEYFHYTHPNVLANLADIYLHTISYFRFRIMLSGTKRNLEVKENMEKIRALLLAGVRAAVLWRQAGGSRLQLFFMRSKIKKTAELLLEKIVKKETLNA